jgi:hypothetical protein
VCGKPNNEIEEKGRPTDSIDVSLRNNISIERSFLGGKP